MPTFEWIPLGFGLLLASLDVVMLGLIKWISRDKLKLLKWMIIPTLSYAFAPWIFLQSLKFESLVVMNLMWDLVSDVLVTAFGFLYFKETVGPIKKIGIGLSLISICLMSISDGEFLCK